MLGGGGGSCLFSMCDFLSSDGWLGVCVSCVSCGDDWFGVADYKGQPLTARQEKEWNSVVQTLEELVKIDQIAADEQLHEEEPGQGNDDALTTELGEDNEFWGEVLDKSPISSPYEEASVLEYHSDAWEFERPDFSELSMLQIQEHATKLKSKFTPCHAGVADVLRFESRQYFHLNPTNAMPIREAKVAVKFNANDLGLSNDAQAKLILLVGSRYNDETGEVKLVSTRYPSAEMNKEYLNLLLIRLVKEAKL